jgi:hypothetical protein
LSAIRRGQKSLDKWACGKRSGYPAPCCPAKRIVAFYGNPLSKKMGVLGEYPVDQMLAKLDQAVAEWKKADPSTPVQPALHLIACRRAGRARTRRDVPAAHGHVADRKGLRLGAAEERAALPRHQVGKSNLQAEIPRLFPSSLARTSTSPSTPSSRCTTSAKGMAPGRKIGEMSADDVNYAIRTLTQLVKDKKLLRRCSSSTDSRRRWCSTPRALSRRRRCRS